MVYGKRCPFNQSAAQIGFCYRHTPRGVFVRHLNRLICTCIEIIFCHLIRILYLSIPVYLEIDWIGNIISLRRCQLYQFIDLIRNQSGDCLVLPLDTVPLLDQSSRTVRIHLIDCKCSPVNAPAIQIYLGDLHGLSDIFEGVGTFYYNILINPNHCIDAVRRGLRGSHGISHGNTVISVSGLYSLCHRIGTGLYRAKIILIWCLCKVKICQGNRS